MSSDVNVSPVDADGMWKDAEECFVEAFNRSDLEYSKISSDNVSFTEDMTPKHIAEKLISAYGTDWSKWLPETLRTQVELDFGNVPDTVYNKIFAIKLMLTNDDFWNNIFIFKSIVLTFNSVIPDFQNFQEVSPAQIVYGILESRNIRESEFDDSIKDYIKNVLFDHGLFIAPKRLSFMRLNMSDGIVSENLNNKDEETFEGIQSAKLNAIEIYLKDRGYGN